METKKEWVVFLLAQIKNSTENDYFKPLLEELKKIKLTTKVEFIFCVNFKLEFWPSEFIENCRQTQNFEGEKYSTCLFRLAAGNSRKNELQFIEEIPDFDITFPNDIGKRFIRNILSQYSAKRCLLFTWDHGNGYSVFEGIGNANSSSLTMQGLNKAIEIGLGGNKQMDLMIMSNCWMQLIDTPYALQNSVEYLVAPQDDVCLEFYDYKKFFRTLTQSPNISAFDLSIFAVHSIQEKFRCPIKTYSVCSVNLINIGTFFLKLDLLADRLRKRMNIDTNRGPINSTFIDAVGTQFLASYILDSGNRYIDLYSLLNNLLEVLKADEASLCQELIIAYNKVVIGYNSNYPDRGSNKWGRPHGITVYCPFSIPISNLAVDRFQPIITKNVKETDFKNTVWMKLMSLLDELYKNDYE